MTNIIGVSAHYHDSAACLIQDGVLVAAVAEEAFTRRKHDSRFPVAAIRYCLAAGGITLADVDWYGYYELPHLKQQRIVASARASAPGGRLDSKIAASLADRVDTDLGALFPRANRHGKVFAIEHHLSHAASAFYPSPYERAAIVTIDGVGEYTTAAVGAGEGNDVRLLRTVSFPHSLGLLYSAFTYYCGFKVNSGEYKLMGLAPYGQPRYVDAITSNLIRLGEDGAFRLNLDYFAYLEPGATVLINEKFEALFGRPARSEDEPLDEFHADVAASVQAVFEQAVLGIARFARSTTGLPDLCMAGGGALNCVANSKILEAGVFERVWVQPAASDAGGALGVASYLWHKHLGNPRVPDDGDAMRGALLGPDYDDRTIRLFLESVGARYTVLTEAELLDRTAGLLAEGKIVGWFQGRMEYGPRALGNRSILADARPADMQRRLNLSIKYRESFRPFAPAVTIEAANEFFDLAAPSPYMLFTAPVTASRRLPIDVQAVARQRIGLDALGSDIPAVTHVDYSARLQTVDQRRNPLFWSLLTRFGALTGYPVLVNTSFNVRGEPIVCTPEDALRCFLRTEMDVLVLGRFLLHKADQMGVELDLDIPIELD